MLLAHTLHNIWSSRKSLDKNIFFYEKPVQKCKEIYRFDVTTASVVLYPDEMIQSIEEFYSFKKYLEVSMFLKKHGFLFPLLLQAPQYIWNYFGKGTSLTLEVVTDPEWGDQQLVLGIQTNLDVHEALDRLDQLDEQWWIRASGASQGKLCIQLEYV